MTTASEAAKFFTAGNARRRESPEKLAVISPLSIDVDVPSRDEGRQQVTQLRIRHLRAIVQEYLVGSAQRLIERVHSCIIELQRGPPGTLDPLVVVPTEVVNAADGWPVADPAVWSARVVVLEPVWQGFLAVLA